MYLFWELSLPQSVGVPRSKALQTSGNLGQGQRRGSLGGPTGGGSGIPRGTLCWDTGLTQMSGQFQSEGSLLYTASGQAQ